MICKAGTQSAAWAAEYGPSGVRVDAVAAARPAPGWMATVPIEMANHAAAMAPVRRIAEPEELAAAIVFLAGDNASVIHGVNLGVDGGRTAV